MKLEAGKHYLAVCYSNLARSPFVAAYLERRARELKIPVEVDSAGLVVQEKGRKQFDACLAQWADIVLVMQDSMQREIQDWEELRGKKLINLDIPDIYSPSFDDSRICPNMTPTEVALYFEAKRNVEGFKIGKRLFEKLLKARLEERLRLNL